MWRHGYFRQSVLLAAFAAGTATLLSLGGCPVAQQPSVPSVEEPNQVGQTPPQTTDDIPRPVTAPPIPDTTTSSGGSNEQPGQQPGGGGSDPSSGGAVVLKVSAPAENFFVRPGQQIQVKYDLVDAQGAVNSAKLAVVRDENNDGKPDGGIVFSQNLVFKPGANTASLNTGLPSFVSLLNNGVGRFRVGIEITTVSNVTDFKLGLGLLTVDAAAPQGLWIAPLEDALVNRQPWLITIAAVDNANATVRVLLDPDPIPLNGNEFELLAKTPIDSSGKPVNFSPPLTAFPANTYHYYVQISDNIEPPTAFYATDASGKAIRLRITDRLVGNFDLETLTNSNQGAIMQGFNFNDLAGNSMSRVPDLTGDNRDELIVVSRFGKPFLIQKNGVGFGEAYMIYGNEARLKGVAQLNSVGNGSVDGLAFPGIRSPLNQTWTNGMSDVSVVPDMDGDDLPELVFSFPRTESINLGETNTAVQHPELVPDIGGMGSLEYNANTPFGWSPNKAQFTRGGIVIVSSHNALMQDNSLVNRKFDRVLDLHEIGQMFSAMSRPSTELYVYRVLLDGLDPFGCEDCIACMGPCPDPNNQYEPAECVNSCLGIQNNCDETFYQNVDVIWDTVFNNQGPGGFHQPWTAVPADPPLANPGVFPYSINFLNTLIPPTLRCDDLNFDGMPDGCEVQNLWRSWTGLLPHPCTTITTGAWETSTGSGTNVWTGFYGPGTGPRSYAGGGTTLPPTSIGARILGQAVDDKFGTALGADGTFLYISAPKHTATAADVPELSSAGGNRNKSGVVYQLRTNAKTSGGPTLTQLWIEPGVRQLLDPNLQNPDPNDPNNYINIPIVWPYCDAQIPNRQDVTIPVPHQYIIESIGSIRSNPPLVEGGRPFPEDVPQLISYTPCPPPFDNPNAQGETANWCSSSQPYPSGTAGFYVDRTPQIVGPHANSEISFVTGLGDVNGDGYRDFAVGSSEIRTNFTNPNAPTGDKVGGVFIVYSRPTGLEGDYLLEQLSLDVNDPKRLKGVYLRGASTGETLARVFADAGDVNGDGYADVIVGNEGANGGAGEAIVLLGSPNLISPLGGWTPASVPAGTGFRLVGQNAGDLVGANVASAGDVDGDGLSDVLIAAPGADGGKGAVYLIYGAKTLSDLAQPIALADVAKVDLPGVRFAGRKIGDFVGGGSSVVAGTDPGGGSTTTYSKGLASLGDIDGDGAADFSLSAMLADPEGKTNAGEVYILYGKKGP